MPTLDIEPPDAHTQNGPSMTLPFISWELSDLTAGFCAPRIVTLFRLR